MADVNLGPAGAEITLPALKFMGGPPSLPVSANKQIEEAEMSDKSKRWAFYGIKREWPLIFGYLTLAELNVLRGLNDLNQVLRFQNNNEDATWYNVVITSFRHDPERTDIRSLGRYKCEMILSEA